MDPEHAEQLADHHMREDRQYKTEQRKQLEAFIRRIIRDELKKYVANGINGRLYKDTP